MQVDAGTFCLPLAGPPPSVIGLAAHFTPSLKHGPQMPSCSLQGEHGSCSGYGSQERKASSQND
eukprot:scaffold232231_cov14-Tisochrysis_lutea.AAC.1